MSQVKELVEFDAIAAGIAEIQEKGNFIPDMSTKEGYQASKRFVLDETTPTRTRLDRAHKTAKAYWKLGGQNVDNKKNEILDLLVEIQKPHQDAYKEFDQIEKDKKLKFESDIQDKINFFNVCCHQASSANSTGISDLIDSCGEIDTDEGFYHLKKEAIKARADALEFLGEALASAASREAAQQREAELAEQNRIKQEALAAQQEEMRVQQEKMNAQQVEIDRVANEAAAKAQAEADEKQRLINETEQAEIEKQRAIEREQYAKQQTEQAAQQAVEQEKQRQHNERIAQEKAQAKLEANKKHTGMIRGEIKDHLISTCGIDNALATKIVKALLHINRVTINY